MTDFWQVVFTPSFMPRLLHVFMASWTVGAALMMSVSAWYLLRKRHLDLAKANMKVALAGVHPVRDGELRARRARTWRSRSRNEQPLKLASMEGLWESTSCAPLYLVGWVDEATQTTTGISIPCLLSVLAYFNPQATVQGINSFAAGPDAADQPRVSGLPLHVRHGVAVRADRPAGRPACTGGSSACSRPAGCSGSWS